MQKIIAAAALLATIAAAAWLLGLRGSGLDSFLETRGLHADFKGFAVTRDSVQNVKGHTVVEVSAAKGVGEVKVIIVENGGASADSYTEQRLFQITSQFNRGVSPYPGAISEHNTCPKEFMPVVERAEGAGWTGKLITAAMNSRKQFGVCEQKEKHFDAAVLLMTCASNGRIFDITAMVPDGGEEIRSLLRQVKCL